MLSQLLSSKPKTSLINLLLAHPARAFAFTELKVDSNCPPKLLKQTLKELDKMEFLSVTQRKRTKYYQMNRHFALYPELVNLLRKVKNIPQDQLFNQASRVGDCKFVALTGVFVGRPRIETDLLFVGKVSPKKLEKFLKFAERLAEQEISYTVFSQQEFEYRKIMNDRFVKNILENSPVVVVDKTKQKKSIAKLVYKL
jgi:hypothetical protein